MNKQNQPTWTNYLAETWSAYRAPIRPAAEELKIFHDLLAAEHRVMGRNLDVLILGSTPELRDLSHSLGFVPTIVDYSEPNYLAMGLLCCESGEERFINADWLRMDIDQQYDLILSEAAFGVVPREDLDHLLSRIQAHLRPQGTLLAKTWIRLSNDLPNLEAVISRYRMSESERDFYSTVCLPLMLHFYDYQSEKIAVRQLSMQVEELFRAGQVCQSEWESIKRHQYENVDLELHIPLIDDLLVSLRKYFTVEDIRTATFDYSGFHPIFVCRRR